MIEKRTPEIRFLEYNDDWETSDLGKMSIAFEYGLNAAAKEYDGKNKYIRITDIDDESRVFIQTNLTSPDIAVESLTGYQLEEGDIVFARTGASVGKSYIYKTSDGLVYYAGFLIRARIKSEHCAEFVFYNTLTEKYEKFIYITSQRSGQPGVNAQEYATFEMMIPRIEEQKKIGQYFSQIDELINLHQRKCEKLKNIRETMLEKMFPKNGCDVPEIRFKGFSSAWELHEVGEYYDFKNGLNKGKEYFGEGTPIVNFTDVFHHRGIYSQNLNGKVTLDISEIKNYEVKKGDLFFTRTSETIEEIGYPSVMLDCPENTVFSGFVLRGRTILEEDPLDDLFKKYVFFTNVFRKEMIKKSSMTTRALTSGTAIKSMEFKHPVDKEEQHKIGQYFTDLDNLIELHQCKIKKLKNIKSASLKKMFV